MEEKVMAIIYREIAKRNLAVARGELQTLIETLQILLESMTE